VDEPVAAVESVESPSEEVEVPVPFVVDAVDVVDPFVVDVFGFGSVADATVPVVSEVVEWPSPVGAAEKQPPPIAMRIGRSDRTIAVDNTMRRDAAWLVLDRGELIGQHALALPARRSSW
jgi:hypothetical protein